MRRTIWAAALLAGFVLAVPATATDLQTILEQQRTLRAELDGQRRPELTKRQVNVIRKTQDQVFALTEGTTRLEELSIDDKVKLENALERINAELVNTRASRDNQEQCHREQKTGSKLEVTRCGTREEHDQQREGARAWMEKPKICIPPGCGT